MAMAYTDEEEALSFNVWVAELELLVGNARGNRRVDPVYSFELLQKLQGSIQRSDRAQLHNYQRKCEDALTTVLLKGAPPPVRYDWLSRDVSGGMHCLLLWKR